jgi:hypothetical protein
MKTFDPLAFDPVQCRKEVAEFQKWLARQSLLDEQKHILPFFRKRRHLSAFIAAYNPNVIRFNRIAFEYPLFGDFGCDLAVGDSVKHAYSFIEFEDAGPNSLFVKQGKKATREWSPRFGHTGILVVGRDQYLQPGERERLEWRRNHVVVASQNIQCVTFDGLLEDLQARLETFPLTAKAGG